MTGVFFAAAAAFAVADWFAVARKKKSLEYLCKPAALVALIGAALAIHPAHDGRKVAFVVALVFSLAGDVFLMLPRDAFVFGLGSFLVAHIAYIVGFAQQLHSGVGYSLVSAAFVGGIAMVGARVLRTMRTTDRALAVPVLIYIVAITLMGVLAIHSGIVLAAAGAVLFASSDSLIAWNRFVRPLAWAPLTIIVTYHVAQALLVASLRF